MNEEFAADLTRRVRHEIELWIERQVREQNIGSFGIPLIEAHSLLVNVISTMAMTMKQYRSVIGTQH